MENAKVKKKKTKKNWIEHLSREREREREIKQ